VDVAVCILRSLYEPERDGMRHFEYNILVIQCDNDVDEDRKTLCRLLGDLHISNDPAPLSLIQLKILLSHLQKVRHLVALKHAHFRHPFFSVLAIR
jgi:hypothetical protein